MSRSRRGLAASLFIIAMLLVFASVWVSSRDETQAFRESGPELAEPSLAPMPSETTQTASASSSPLKKKVIPVTPGVPSKLVIRKIGVTAPVEQGTILADGTQEVPESMSATSWLKDGVLPGNPGNAVLTGHTCSRCDGVFDRLPEMAKGDLIHLFTTEGKQTYRVISVGSIPVGQFDEHAASIYATQGLSGLVLMTCGDWNGSSYDATTVVFAQLVR